MEITSISQLDPQGTYTYADYLTWRFEQMVEIIKGKLYMMSPAPASRHQKISSGLLSQLLPFFNYHRCGVYHAPFDVRLIKERKGEKEILSVVQPDISVVCDESKIDEKGCLGSPDWIIEIISPSTAKKDFNEKYNLYQENGVKEYWIVNPDANCMYQYVLNEATGLYDDKGFFGRTEKVTPALFPDLLIELEFVFQ
jgi:Uma2 family endonuclease